MNDKRDQLYDNLINSGRVSEDEIGNREQFKDAISDEATSRQFYNNIINSGVLTADDIGSEDDFFNSISSDFSSPAQQGYQPSAEDMAGFMGTINRAGKVASGTIQSFDSKTQNLQKRQGLNVPQRVNLGESNNLVEGDQRLNPETGQLENTYITSSGNEYDNKALADIEQRQQDQYDRDRRYKQSLPGQLEDAYAERDRLNAELAKLQGQWVDQDGRVHYGNRGNDEAAASLEAALRQNQQRITALEAERDDDGGTQFWRGFIDAAQNPSTLTFGMTDFADMIQMMRIKNKMDSAIESGQDPQLSESEQSLLQSSFLNNYAQQQYGENRGFMYRAGGISMQALPFVAEFMATGGMGAISQKGAELGTRAAEKLALQGLSRSLVKNLGIVAGDVAAGWAMANTTGIFRTAGDVMQRNMGDVTINPEGEYDFGEYDEEGNYHRGGKSLGRSIYEAEVANTLEYYTEKLGEHLQIGKWLAKGADKMGLSKLSKVVNYLSGNKWLERGGIQDYPSEVVEEEANLLLNGLLVGDNNFSMDPNSREFKKSAFNPKTQLDIWGGMLFSIGLMQAPRLAYAGYYAYKKGVDMADNDASIVFGADNWQMIKDEIDTCENDKLSELMQTVVDGDMTDVQKTATLNYAKNLIKMRGYNMGMMAGAKDLEETNSNEGIVSQAVNQSYQQGHEAQDPDLMKQFNDEAQEAAANLPQYGQEFAKMVIESQSPIETMDYLMQKRDIFTDEQIASAADYFQKLSRVNGAMDGALDRVDLEVERANAEVRSNIHQQTGNVITAQVGDGAYYVIGGDIVTDPDTGMTSLVGTGGAVVVKNALTGEISVKSPQEVVVTSMTNADEMLQYNNEVLRNQLIQQSDDDFTYGSPANEIYQLEDTVTLNNGEGNTIEGEIGMMPNAVDGVYVVYTPDGKALQFTADQLNRMIVAHNGLEVQRTNLDANTDNQSVNTQTGENYAQNQPENIQSSDLDNAGAEASAENGTGANDAPATALSRIPVLTDENGQPVLKKGRPQYQWHKANTEDAAAALIETTGGNMVMARDNANRLVKTAKDKLEKIRKQEPKGEDPLELAESSMAIQKQIDDTQATIKQWQDVAASIQKQMNAESERLRQEAEAKKSEEQRQREAAEAEERKQKQAEIDRQRIRESIERDREKRNKVYEPLADARKEMADDPDAIAILSDTEPRDLSEWVSSLLRPHSMLWQNASQSEIGLQSELGLKRADMQRFINLLGTKENGAKSFGQVVLDIHEGLTDAMKDQYTDEDVRQTLLDLFSEGNSTRMLHLTEEHRIDEAREAYRENLRRAAEYELEQWAEAYHLTPEERETYEDFLSEDYFNNNAALNNEQEFIDKIIADEEQNRRGQEMDLDNTSGTAGREGEGGESQVQRKSAAEETAADQNQQQDQRGETPAGSTTVPDTDVSGGTPQRVTAPKGNPTQYSSFEDMVADTDITVTDNEKKVILRKILDRIFNIGSSTRKQLPRGEEVKYVEYWAGIRKSEREQLMPWASSGRIDMFDGGNQAATWVDEKDKAIYSIRYSPNGPTGEIIIVSKKTLPNGETFPVREQNIPSAGTNNSQGGNKKRPALDNPEVEILAKGGTKYYTEDGNVISILGSNIDKSKGERRYTCKLYDNDEDFKKGYPNVTFIIRQQDMRQNLNNGTYSKTKPVKQEPEPPKQESKNNQVNTDEILVKDGTVMKNNIAGGDAVVRIVGSKFDNNDNERQYLVEWYANIDDVGQIAIADGYIGQSKMRRNLQQRSFEPLANQETQKPEPKTNEPKRLVSDERMEELKKLLRNKLGGQATMGVDPEIVSYGVQLAVGYLERGITKLADFTKKMIEDIGEAIRPYVDKIFSQAREETIPKTAWWNDPNRPKSLDRWDYTTYMTDEAKEYFANFMSEDGKTDFTRWAHPELAYLTAAAWDGANIPYDVLKRLPEIKEAEKRVLKALSKGKPVLTDEEAQGFANRLFDAEHGSAVYENGKLKKVNGVAQFTGPVRQERKAFYVIGRPAGGKSSVFANPLSYEHGARIIDSDTVKPWIEGFDDGYWAGFVQDASTQAYSKALKMAIERGDNIILPRVGGNSVVDEAMMLKERGYNVELLYNDVSEETSIMRAVSRFAEEGRFLSLHYLTTIKGKIWNIFSNFAEENIGGYYAKRGIPVNDRRIGRSTDVLEGVRSNEGGNNATLQRGTDRVPEMVSDGRSQESSGSRDNSGSSENSEGRSGELIFSYSEWKSNDVAFGEKPVEIWNSASGQPMPQKEVKNNETESKVSRESGAAGEGAGQASGSADGTGAERGPESNRPERTGSRHSVNHKRIVSDSRMEELKKRLKSKLLGQLNVGVDPEILAVGAEIAVGYLERGVTKFADFTKTIIDEVGDFMRPYLKSFYNAVRDMPEAQSYADQMDDYQTVSNFDVHNFDKQGTPDALTKAQQIVDEKKVRKDVAEITDGIDIKETTINDITDETDEQTAADTTAIVSEAETLASEARSAKSRERRTATIKKIDEQLEKIDNQLAFIGFYDVDPDAPYHESYGRMKSAEKKAVADATKVARQIAKDLGIDAKPKAKANMAPIGGDITFRIPVTDDLDLYFDLSMERGYESYPDSLEMDVSYFRLESKDNKPQDNGRYRNYANNFFGVMTPYDELLNDVRQVIKGAGIELAEPKPEKKEPKKPASKRNKLQIQNEEPSLFDMFFDEEQPDNTLGTTSSPEKIEEEEAKVDTNPTEAQKEAGNYQKGHIQIDGYDITIENPKGSVRRGTDASGKPWETTMHNTYGYVRGTEGVDGDHIDVFLSDNPTSGSVYVVDQVNPSTGDFDEHKVMYGFDSEDEAREAYLSNYNKGWKGLGNITEVSREDFKKWVESSHRKTKPFAEYKSVNKKQTTNRELPKHNNKRNNRGERGQDYAPTSPKARFNANVEAIKLMRLLNDEGIEAPTKDQMEVLRKYSGWGGMGTYFNDDTMAENKILRELLTEEEYNDAVMSINSAYYTPATVIDTLWDVAKALGFKGGNVLEGSAGIGNIIGQMPAEMSSRSDIEAVEIDKISGNILKLLYPDAKVHIEGFQDVRIPNGTVDLAVTNVPFVTGLHVIDKVDKDLSRKFTNIHDFCIAKNIRKLREGGIGIFITSSGTMDKSTKLREWIPDEGQSDVIGAFRLNNETFGGTNVTSDIIVVRKRVGGIKSENAIDISKASPLRVGSYEDKFGNEKQTSMTVNDYFRDHPEMMAGEMAFGYEKGDTFRPGSYGLYPVDGKSQEKLMQDFVSQMKKVGATEKVSQNVVQVAPKAEPNQLTAVKEGRMLVDDKGRICVSRYGTAWPLGLNDQKVKGHTKQECFADYQDVQKAVDDVLQQQLNDPDDAALKPKLDALNKAYDKFTKRYGTLHKNTSISFLRNDIDFPSFQALENYSETKDMKGKVKIETKKAPLFTQRVLGFRTEPKPENIKDAVTASLFRTNTIDLQWIGDKLGKSVDDVKNEILESRLGFEDPSTGQMEIRYKYLSGNVREKLAIAEGYNTDGKYAANVEELRKAVPMDIPSHLIDFSLGSSWIPIELYKDYIKETLDLSNIKLTHVEGAWIFDEGYSYHNEKNRSAGVYSEKFRETIYGHQLVSAALNNRPVKVSKQVTVGYGDSKHTETRVDQNATSACAVRVDEIKDDFKQWAKKKMQDNPELAQQIEKIYNDKFNALVPMQIDDEFLPEHFEGSNVNISLYDHQKRGVMRGLTAPTMLAHEVGTGKSFTLISTAMEMRRLGTAKKPMIVVQNATVAQITSDAKLLYPNAKVLSLTEKDRNAEGRRAFYASIKYNDWDMVIIPQSTLNMIPDSPERELQFIQEKIDEKKHVIEAAEAAGADSRQLQQMKKELDKLEQEYGDTFLDKDPANSTKKKKKDAKKEAASLDKAETKAKEMLDRAVDDVQYFDDLGVDALLVDEAHEYKHLGFQTSIGRGIKGIDPSYSKKCAGLYNKTRAVFEKAGWKNVVFATGTPISNTAAEIWTFMKYLMPADVMRQNDIYYFDDFVHNFGAISQMLEFATSGKFKENTRFAAYVNKPELIRIWSQVADTVLTKEVGAVKEKVPKKEGDKDLDVFLPQSPSLISIMAAVRAELERFENMTGKEKKENSSIPLTMYGIAKRAAIDPRLVNPDAPDEPMSKTNAAVKEIVKDLKATDKYKGTVAVFCDNQNRKGADGSIEFNIYEDMRNKLIEAGVPSEQIAIIKSGMSITAKQKVFDAVNTGAIRVVLGSTQTLGTGVNMQERLHLLIHMDAPDRPMDYTQRNGRIERQGNLHKTWDKPIRILRFGVEDSLDVTAYQRLKTKSGFIDSIMDGKGALLNNQVDRTVEEEEEGLFDNPVAVLSGSQYALKKNQAERELRKYKGKKAQWEADQVYVANTLRRNKSEIADSQKLIGEYEAEQARYKKMFPDGKVKTVTVEGENIDLSKGDAEAYVKLVKTFKEKIQDPVNATVKKLRENPIYNDETLNFKVELDGHPIDFKIDVYRTSEYDNGKMKTVLHKGTHYKSADLQLTSDVSDMSKSARDCVEEIMQDYISGNYFTERIETFNNKIDRLNEESEQLQKRVGMEFQFGKELEEAKKHVDEYTELMKKEMEEKEAKYAAQQKEAQENGGSFDLKKAEDSEDEDFYRIDDDMPWEDDEENPIFFSNAMQAVDTIQQDKAAPQQWLAMIVKNGGLKAGEDKWLGLSDWLNNSDKKSITKQEVKNFIRMNQIYVDETHYQEQEEMDSILDGIYEQYGLEFRDEFAEAFDIEYDEFMIRDEQAAVDLWNREHVYQAPLEYDGYMLDEETEHTIMDWANEIVDKVNSRTKPINNTRLQYTTKGLQKKREIALTVPTIEQYGENDPIHFGDAGGGRAIAWVRFGETTTKDYDDPYYQRFKTELEAIEKERRDFEDKVWNGKPHQEGELPAMSNEQWEEYDKLLKKAYVARLNVKHSYTPKKVLVIDEIQSKRHQEGRNKGYKGNFKAYRSSNDQEWLIYDDNDNKVGSMPIYEAEDPETAANKWGVPDAPFEKNWHELAMKRMLRYAAENGYDKIAWTTGGQQAERYDIGRVIDEIGCTQKWEGGKTRYDLYPKNGDGSISLFVKDGKVINSAEESLIGKDLSDVVGKALAEKMLDMQPDETLLSNDLLVGNEGMKGFYDDILVRFMNKYGRKWGVTVYDQDYRIADDGHVDENGKMVYNTNYRFHTIDVTPQMKESVMLGQPMFRDREQFSEGETFPIYKGEYHSSYNVLGNRTTFSTDLMPDEYQSEHSLLDALRNQYPEFYVTIEDGRVKMQTFESVMAGAVLAKTAKKAKGTESYVERKTRQAINAVEDMARRMNIDVEVLTSTDGLTEKKARAKGWFNPKTHKITIVLPNHSNQSDVINTLLHEGVAHYGLRKMFGEHFDTFLDNVYNNVDPQVKARIDAAIKRNGWSRHTATEEYLARLAERTDFEHASDSGWWQKIKDFFINMLAKSGFNTILTDNELRYILWRSYDNLLHPNERRTIFDTAREIDMQARLKVGDFAERIRIQRTGKVDTSSMVVAESDVDEINQIINDAKANGTYMKSPNGNPTNLTEEQWVQVRTKAFKNWFGDWLNDPDNASKVVDENGEPQVMYHGTNLTKNNNGEAFWVFYPESHFGTKGQSEDVMKNTGADQTTKTYEVFLNIRKPDRNQDVPKKMYGKAEHKEWWDALSDYARKNDFDGIVYQNRWEDQEHPADSWIAFNPNQIKSATDNSGAFSPENDDIRYSLRTKQPPKKTGIGYKVFVLKNGQLYPPMVANPNGEGTPVGVWLDADAAPIAGTSKTGRPQVKAGGKGTQGGSGQLAYRPGWHLGTIPYALQFNRKDDNGEKTLFPNNFVWAEVEYADDVDYQDEARKEGMNANGKYQHSLAGLKHVPTDGSYKYRTNPDPRTDEWVITGAMRVNKILSREEVDELVRKAGREPQPIQDGDVLDQESIDALNAEIQAMKEADEMSLLYRDDEDWGDEYVEPFEENYDIARTIYEKAAASDALKFQEAWQDKMAGLKILQNAIEKETGKKATGAEDAYLYENRMHGKAKNQSEAYDRKFYKPVLKAADNMMKAKGWTDIRQLTDYMVAKHGLERNIFYAFKEAVTGMVRDNINKEQRNLSKRYERGEIDALTYKKEQKELQERESKDIADKLMEVHNDPEHIRMKEDYEAGRITYADYITNEENLRRSYAPDFDEYYKDYSGLTELTGDETDYMTKALAMVDDAERDSHKEVSQLWSAVNAATKETLRFAYESGTMSRNTYNNVRAMFEYYIPLRGWEENNADDFYDYVSERNVFSTAIKKAYGRKSLAENPIAYIGNMAVSTLLAGHRNLLKQHFLNYVMNNPTSLVSVSEKWFENKGTETSPYWVEVAPEIPADATADQIADIVEAFNEDMKQKAAEGKATTTRGNLQIAYHATGAEKNEHMVEVQRAGKTYQLYINGNPKAAQALNGINEKAVSRISQTDFGKLVEKINRNMAAFFTSKNPAFVLSNLSRDLTMAGASVAIKEDAEYNRRFIANVFKVLRPRIGKASRYNIYGKMTGGQAVTGMMPSLMRKYLDGDLNLNNETERLFGEFMDEGAETGFVNMLSVDSFKEQMQKEISHMQGVTLNIVKAKNGTKETPIGKGLRMMGDIFEFYNRCAEDATRFIVYMTSRQMGKSLEDSIADAKDVTLNFNRKGTGAKWNAVVRDLFIFVNPAIQALSNMFKMAYKHPVKFTVVTEAFIVGGLLMPIVNQWLLNLFGDDDDKDSYWNLPPWVRKNNLVMWVPGTKNFITIPLAQEFRVFYGLGEMATSLIYDHPVHDWPMEILSSFMDLVPINPTGNGGNLVVDLTPTLFQPLVQLDKNIDFTGKPIWKENQGNKYAPMYTKAYVATPEWMVDLSKAVNDLTGGNEGKKGVLEEYMWGGNYVNNPAVWNHLMQGYFGGMYNTIAKGFDVAVTAGKGELPKVYQTPVINRFLNRPVERDNAGVLGEEYYKLIEERDRLKFELRTWQKKADEGDEDAQAHIDEIMSSGDYQRMLIIDHYDKIMKDLKAGEKSATMDIDKADIKESITLYKTEMMEELAAIDNGKDPLEAAMEKFNEAKTFSEKNKLRMRIEKLMLRQAVNTKKSGDEVAKALSYRDEEDRESHKVNEKYLELATAEQIADDARIRAAKAKIKTYTDEFKRLVDSGAGDKAVEYRKKHLKYFVASDIINQQSRITNSNKKLLGNGHDKAIMKLIDQSRNKILKAIDKIE